MKFGRIPIGEAEGGILAHSIRQAGVSFKKGRLLDGDDVQALRAAGLSAVVAARLEADEIGEDEAAERVTAAVTGRNLVASAPFTGRCNLYSSVSGLLVYERGHLDRLNLIDEAITLAALPPFSAVAPRQMVATIKIIPYGVATATVAALASEAGLNAPVLGVAEFVALRAGLVQTGAGRVNVRVLDKTRATLEQRLARLGSRLVAELRCDHHEDDVARCVDALAREGCELILIAGASATADRNDVVPAGIRRAGGSVTHVGMPVEPGNLLLLGELSDHRPVVCLPGCARSPALNGFDWVLERLLARLPVRREDIMRMGSGGLIKNQAAGRSDRRSGQESADEALPSRPAIAAVILAAGGVQGAGGTRKLLEPLAGEAVISRVVRTVLASQARPVVVVVGEDAGTMRNVLAAQSVQIVDNADFAEGISGSLRLGIGALPEEIAGAVVCLGDMPWIRARDIDRLIAAFDPGEDRLICVASHRGQRGHPVLWARRFFSELEQVRGDSGAKALFERHADFVCDVEAGHDGVVRDLSDAGKLPQAAGI